MSPEKHLDSDLSSGLTEGVTRTIGPTETAGALIDRYHLLQKIGEGGIWMGCSAPSAPNIHVR